MPWNIYGHEWAAHLLQEQIAQNGIRHAYLFAGPSGVGRRTLALRFAQAVNCLQPPAPGEPCGTCRMCTQLARMQQSDLSVVQAEREGGEILIDSVRTLQHSLSLSPYEASYRIALLLRFHEANENAQNALLKTLEEAPPRAILLLTVNSPEDVLPTIASRCEIIRLRPMPLDAARAQLIAQWKIDPLEAEKLAHISGGRLGYAVTLSQNPEALEKRETLLNDLLNLLQQPRRERFAYAEKKAKARNNTREEREKVREELRLMFTLWIGFWRDVLLRAVGAETPCTNLDFTAQIDQLAAQANPADVRVRIHALESALQRLPNANLQLLLEVLLLDL